MPGIKIGNGAIVASRSVVVSDVPSYTIVGGNPAKTIKQRFEPEAVAKLNQIAWWDWPIQKITEHLDKIVSGDIEALSVCAANV
jgi:virginiamycin A acetyltransferase